MGDRMGRVDPYVDMTRGIDKGWPLGLVVWACVFLSPTRTCKKTMGPVIGTSVYQIRRRG